MPRTVPPGVIDDRHPGADVSAVPGAHGSSPDRHPQAWRLVGWSAAAGVALAIIWSFELVDSVIGAGVAETLLGEPAEEVALTSTGIGFLYAFVSGLAGTFTACNVAVASAVGPMAQSSQGAGLSRSSALVRSLGSTFGLFTVGMVAVAATYGALGVIWGEHLPQLSSDMVGTMPVRLLQSSVIFGLIGLALTLLGLAALGILRDPFASRPRLRIVVLGALVGGFLVGRPFPLFERLFHWAVGEGNPLAGAAVFTLQSLGNITFVALLYVMVVLATRGGILRWLVAKPSRLAAISGVLLVGLGVFTVVYWDLRVPAMFGYGWFPSMPYS